MAESKFKLTYFTLQGIAEPIRYVFAYADVSYEDKRISKTHWPVLKETMPHPRLPFLEVDGNSISQSVAITRYLGKRFGLIPEDPFLEALLEALVDDEKDFHAVFKKAMVEKTEQAKKDFDVAMEYFFKKLEPLAAKGYLYGSPEATWVDLYIAAKVDAIEQFIGEVLEPYPNLKAMTERIKNKESVRKYISQRPPDDWTF